MHYSRLIASFGTWIAAVILVLLPIVVAADYGGVLRWTHYVAALVALMTVFFAAFALLRSDGWGGVRQYMLLIPLFLWLCFAWFQTVPLPAGVVSFLSPGSAQAYTDWINPLIPASEHLSSFPISLAKHDSLHVCALLGLLIGIAWASAALFHERPKLVLLLTAISIGGSLHAGIGLWRLVFPETEAWSAATDTQITAFGAFVNRNNAALMLNFGLAFSLGLLAWRLTALNGLEIEDPSFELNDLLSLTRDRDSFAGLAGAVLCVTGLLACGSRGGLVASCFGLLLAFGWIRQRRGFVSIPVVGTIVAICVALLMVPFHLDLESIQRFEIFSQQDSTTILRNGRLLHWHDGWAAAQAHMPMGSGLSTYAYAYLPHQETSPDAWFHHADNLWLELITEQGFIGVALALSIIVITIIALRRLSDSPDPIDHGLRVTGWFSLTAIVVSQVFDFGLIVFGNLLVATILLSAIVARASMIARPTPLGTTSLFKTRSQKIFTVAAAIVSFALVGSSLPQLKKNAEIESLVRSADGYLEVSGLDPEVLDQWSSQLEAISDNPPPIVSETLANVQYRRARLTEALAANPANVEQFIQSFRQTGPREKRLAWLTPSTDSVGSTAPDRFQSEYRRPFELVRGVLPDLPLDRRARMTMLHLDFVEQNPEFTLTTLLQLKDLHSRNPKTLFDIGRLAADSGQYQLAADVWHQVLDEDYSRTPRVLAMLVEYPKLRALSVLPQKPEILRKAVPFLVRDVVENREILDIAREGLQCESCDSMATRSQCEQLRGDVAYALGRYAEAYEGYRKSLTYDASNVNLRIKLIDRLREQGRRDEAIQEARRAKVVLPDDARFNKMIGEMTQEDLQDLRQGSPSARQLNQPSQ